MSHRLVREILSLIALSLLLGLSVIPGRLALNENFADACKDIATMLGTQESESVQLKEGRETARSGIVLHYKIPELTYRILATVPNDTATEYAIIFMYNVKGKFEFPVVQVFNAAGEYQGYVYLRVGSISRWDLSRVRFVGHEISLETDDAVVYLDTEKFEGDIVSGMLLCSDGEYDLIGPREGSSIYMEYCVVKDCRICAYMDMDIYDYNFLSGKTNRQKVFRFDSKTMVATFEMKTIRYTLNFQTNKYTVERFYKDSNMLLKLGTSPDGKYELYEVAGPDWSMFQLVSKDTSTGKYTFLRYLYAAEEPVVGAGVALCVMDRETELYDLETGKLLSNPFVHLYDDFTVVGACYDAQSGHYLFALRQETESDSAETVPILIAVADSKGNLVKKIDPKYEQKRLVGDVTVTIKPAKGGVFKLKNNYGGSSVTFRP